MPGLTTTSIDTLLAVTIRTAVAQSDDDPMDMFSLVGNMKHAESEYCFRRTMCAGQVTPPECTLV